MCEHFVHPVSAFMLAAAACRETEQITDHPAAACSPFEREQHVVLDREPAENLLSLERPPKTSARPAGLRTLE